MAQCECGKSFKKKSNLARHAKGCNARIVIIDRIVIDELKEQLKAKDAVIKEQEAVIQALKRDLDLSQAMLQYRPALLPTLQRAVCTRTIRQR